MDFCIHVFKRVMEAVNNVDVGEFGAGSLPAGAPNVNFRKISVRKTI